MNASDSEHGKLSPLDFYNVIRQRIEHEDNLIVQRLSWLVGSQSFLYTAYAIVLNGLATPGTNSFVARQLFLFRMLPVIAILICVLISISILAAVRAMAEMRLAYHKHARDEHHQLPAIQVSSAIRLPGLSAPVALPMVFIAVWVVLWLNG